MAPPARTPAGWLHCPGDPQARFPPVGVADLRGQVGGPLASDAEPGTEFGHRLYDDRDAARKAAPLQTFQDQRGRDLGIGVEHLNDAFPMGSQDREPSSARN